MEHTPGPWKLDSKPTDYPQAVASDDGTVVAITGTDRANARLIAAAPALLSALEDNTALLQRVMKEVVSLNHRELVSGIELYVLEAHAAIQAAKGD